MAPLPAPGGAEGGTTRRRTESLPLGFLFFTPRGAARSRHTTGVEEMVTKRVYLTPEGKAALKQELDQLLARRQELLKRIQEEREFGAFAEGSEPDADKTDLAFVEGKILTIENQLKEAVVVSSHDAMLVSLGEGDMV